MPDQEQIRALRELHEYVEVRVRRMMYVWAVISGAFLLGVVLAIVYLS